MKKVLRKTLIVLPVMALFGAATSQATPRKYSRCDVKIEAPEKSTGHYFSEDCSQVFVKPPTRGSIELTSIHSSTSADMCKAIYYHSDVLTDELDRIIDKSKSLKAERETVNDATDGVRIKCNKFKSVTLSKELKLNKKQKELAKLKKESLLVKPGLDTCATDPEGFECTLAQTEQSGLDDEKKDIYSEIADLEYDRDLSQVDVEFCEKELKLVTEQATLDSAIIQQLETTITDLSKKLTVANQALKSSNNEPDTILGVVIDSGHQKLVEEYKSLNEGISFNMMPLKRASVSFYLIRDGKKSGYPIITSSGLIGLSYKATDTADADVRSLEIDQTIAEAANLFGSSMSGQIVLNKRATCDILREKGNLDRDNLADLLKATTTYSYEVQTDRKFEVKYKESYFYQLVQKSKKKKRLFKSSSIKKITERSNSKKWIDIIITSEDSNNIFTNEDKLIETIIGEYANTALLKAGAVGVTAAQANLIDPGATGAKQAAGALSKCPHIYCQYSAIALNVLDGLVGSSASSSEMKRNLQAEEFKSITAKKMVEMFDTYAFDVKKDN